MSAHDLENLVCNRLAEFLVDRRTLSSVSEGLPNDALALRALLDAGDVAAATLRSGSAGARAELLLAMVQRINLQSDGIDLNVEPTRLLTALSIVVQSSAVTEPLVLTCPATKVRRGHQLRLIIPGASAASVCRQRDEKLVALVAEAHAARKLVIGSADTSIAGIAAAAGRCRTRLSRLLALSCLAPDIVTAIVEGRQPPSLTHRSIKSIDLPMAWSDQRTLLGFS